MAAKKIPPGKTPTEATPPLQRPDSRIQPAIRATPAGCLDMEDAAQLVESCIGGAPLELSTPLGDVFESDPARRLFCDRVKDAVGAAGCTRAFPCTPDTTLGEIVDALAC